MMYLNIRTMSAFPKHEIQTYWQTLAMHDTLKYRINDIANPLWDDVQKILSNESYIHTYVKDMNEDNPRIVGECMLEGFKGSSAKLHFSLLPGTTPEEKKEITHRTLDLLLQCFDGTEGGPTVTTLYGVTPLLNRVACIYVLRSRFTKLAVLPDAEIHNGKVCDAMLTVLTRETVKQSLWGLK